MAKKYRDEDIQRVIDNADIKTVVENYVQLKAKGVNFVGICPFHDDTTPSFVVSITKQICKCFSCGEGGNAIHFVMKFENCDFISAVEKVANICNIEITPVELSEEEVKKEKKREELFIALEVGMNYYCECIKANNSNAEIVRDYAHGRWKEEFCIESNIGYAPLEWQGLVNYATSKGYSLEAFEAAGLIAKNKKGGYYDFFRGRMMIPVFNEFGRVISFSGRIVYGIKDDKGNEIVPKDDDRKYLNTKDTDLFHKSSSPFGINIAKREASKKNMMYGVEGAPDALRLQEIGVLNAIATLGSGWSEQGLRKIKRYTGNFCIIPDSDLPKKGDMFSPGFKGAIESAKRALAIGLNVFIKQIPVGEVKNDADSYITSIEIFESIEQKDFIYWYADQLLTKAKTTIEKSNAIKSVAYVVNTIPDAITKETFKESLVARTEDGNLWKAAFDIPVVKTESQSNVKQYTNSQLLSIYGFQIKNNCYCFIDDKNDEKVCSNFILEPILFIKGEGGSRLFKLVNCKGEEALVELSSDDLVNISKFKAKMEKEGNFIWYSSMATLNNVKAYLYEVEVKAYRIIQLGWQSQGFYACGNGAFVADKWVPADELGVVDLGELGKYYLPAFSKMHCHEIAATAIERRFVYTTGKDLTLLQYTEQIVTVFGNNGKIAICFMIASHFRDVITNVQTGFPSLNIFGPKGSGKTELAHSLMAFDVTSNNSPNISNSTLASISGVLGQSKNALIHLDEFKNSITEGKRELLKGCWDGVGRSRANKDTFKSETTPVDSGVVITGQEMATTDPALMNRFVHIAVSKTKFTIAERKEFKKLIEMRKDGCTNLLPEIIKNRALFEKEYPANFEKTTNDVMAALEGYEVEDRTAYNWIKVLAAYRTVENVMDISLSYDELLPIFVNGIISQNDKTKKNSEIGKFWKYVNTLMQAGELYDKGDFEVVMRSSMPCRVLVEEKYIKQNVKFDSPKPVLYLRTERILMNYSKYSKQVEEMIPAESLEYYMEHSPGYIGKSQKKFQIFRNGIPVMYADESAKGTSSKIQTKNETAMCFDYEVVKDLYGVNLGCLFDKEDEEEEMTATEPVAEEIKQGDLPF